MRFLFSPQLYTCTRKGIIENGIIVLDKNNCILDVIEGDQTKEIPEDKIEKLEGALVPGFINAHCHLELSYLKEKLTPHSGLDNFIKQIEIEKSKDKEYIIHKAKEADNLMWQNGIVAVGDICNTDDSIAAKTKSKIHYHSFIETYSFDPSRATSAINKAKTIKAEFESRALKASISPHAPYSVSFDLLKQIDLDANKNSVITIHNQESEDENELYLHKSGKLLERYKHFGINIDAFEATGKNSLASVMPYFKQSQIFLLVHNTVSKQTDIEWMHAFSKNTYWCFCPKANLYIENRLPEFSLFKKNNCHIVVGTDSLASNDTLSILDEITALHSYSKVYSIEDLVNAACINGAKALMIESKFGSLENGKRPGLNEINFEKKTLKKVA
jgi:aminodeoxyfutalosine deaminase